MPGDRSVRQDREGFRTLRRGQAPVGRRVRGRRSRSGAAGARSLALRFQPHQDPAAGLPRSCNAFTVGLPSRHLGFEPLRTDALVGPVDPISAGRTVALILTCGRGRCPTPAPPSTSKPVHPARSEGRHGAGRRRRHPPSQRASPCWPGRAGGDRAGRDHRLSLPPMPMRALAI